jgi:hypothetical protein
MSETKPAGKQGGKKKKHQTLSLGEFLQSEEVGSGQWADDEEEENPFASNPAFAKLGKNAAASVTVWEKPPYTLKVKGLPVETEKEEAYEFFGADEVRFVTDKTTGEFTGTAFLEFGDLQAAQKAREKKSFNGAALRSEPIKSSDKPKSKKGDRPEKAEKKSFFDTSVMSFRDGEREVQPPMAEYGGRGGGRNREDRGGPGMDRSKGPERGTAVQPGFTGSGGGGIPDFRNQDAPQVPSSKKPSIDRAALGNLRDMPREEAPRGKEQTVVDFGDIRRQEQPKMPEPASMDFRNQPAKKVSAPPDFGNIQREEQPKAPEPAGIDFRNGPQRAHKSPSPTASSQASSGPPQRGTALVDREAFGSFRTGAREEQPPLREDSERKESSKRETREPPNFRDKDSKRETREPPNFREGKPAAAKVPQHEVSFGRGKPIEGITWD